MKLIRIALLAIVTFALTFVLSTLGIYGYAKLQDKPILNKANTVNIYDGSDNFVSKTNDSDEWIGLDKIDNDIIDALIATEDRNFYEHSGFDIFRLSKLVLKNISNLKNATGTSTITQQYARTLYLSNDKNWDRKAKEAWFSILMESHYSKEEILEGYLNTVYFGHGVSGIENACKFYFNKSAEDVSLAEASILVGVLSSPGNYSPIINLENSLKRQSVVLNAMKKNGYISSKDIIEAKNYKLTLHGKKDPLNLQTLLYFQDAVFEELSSITSIPEEYIMNGGINIHTTLNVEYQTILEANTSLYIDNEIQSASVIMDPNTHQILALVGGTDYKTSQFNRAIKAKRQVGSAMKPILYYAALESGFTASTAFKSEPTSFVLAAEKTYTPTNYKELYPYTEISLAEAIALSDNIYAVKTNLFLGPEILIETSKRLGIKSHLEPNASLALGTNGISPLEMANAYSVFANGGFQVNPYFIKKVTTLDGEVIFERDVLEPIQILNKGNVFILNELLNGIFDPRLNNHINASGLSINKMITRKYAAKSGTTNTDAWMIGYTPDLVTASWVGYDDNRYLIPGDSAKVKKIWAKTSEEIHAGLEDKWYEVPNNIVGILVDPISGKLATKNTKNSKFLYYIKGSEPEGAITFEESFITDLIDYE